MRRYNRSVAGRPVTINRVESYDDLPEFNEFIRAHLSAGLAVDTETTQALIYSDGFRLRLAQFGNEDTAYVLPVELGGRYAEDAEKAVRGLRRLVLHNAGFDLQVYERALGIPMETLWPRVTDTSLLAHLVDPRGREEGGPGRRLEELTATHIDATVAAEVKGSMTELAREFRTTKAEIYRKVDLDHDGYNVYAGMDVILTARLARILRRAVPRSAEQLVEFERQVAEVCSYYERTGFLLDVEYSSGLAEKLAEDEEKHCAVAANYGVEKVNSTDQVAEALLAQGVEIPDRTKTGKYKVDKKLLDRLVKLDNPLAVAVKEAKKARKWRKTWVETFLATRDGNDRCHANINSLQARTARMSITGIPAQTLPSGDWMIRRCFLAEPGHRPASVDYRTQELRVLAALCQDRTMVEIFRNNGDLHLMTARSAFGDHIQKTDVEREKYAKTANFQKVYGGGPRSLSETLGISLEVSRKIHDGFDKAYPGVERYSKRLQQEARRYGFVTTPSGRRLPVDPDRAYSALNYVIQSSSRDVTARGLIRAHREGFTPYIRLPIHDEALASLPADMAEPEAEELSRCLAEYMGPVHINTDSDVGIRSWGSLYGSEV